MTQLRPDAIRLILEDFSFPVFATDLSSAEEVPHKRAARNKVPSVATRKRHRPLHAVCFER